MCLVVVTGETRDYQSLIMIVRYWRIDSGVVEQNWNSGSSRNNKAVAGADGRDGVSKLFSLITANPGSLQTVLIVMAENAKCEAVRLWRRCKRIAMGWKAMREGRKWNLCLQETEG